MSMRSWPLAVLILLAAGLSAAADDFDAQDMRLLRNPDLHGGTIVFVQGGDLWTVPAAGGEARRLTSHVGYESQPKFSPDGKWIAFSGDYDGNRDVYVIPAAGGEPRRLTWHPLWDRVIDWQPDGKSVRFQSSRTSFTMREQQLWTVPLGGRPAADAAPARGRPVELVAGRPPPRLQPHHLGEPHLEALPGRHGPGHLDPRFRQEHDDPHHRLARRRELPDVARGHDLLHQRPHRHASRSGPTTPWAAASGR